MELIRRLTSIVRERAKQDKEVSYTARLLGEGVGFCARKVGEEAVEVVVAALGEDERRLGEEAADLVFHLMVLLEARGLSMEDVLVELESRLPTSS